LDCIVKIIVSPWLDETLARTTVGVIKNLTKGHTFWVGRSTLLENERWKKCVQPNPIKAKAPAKAKTRV
jgi:hypothetical protein